MIFMLSDGYSVLYVEFALHFSFYMAIVYYSAIFQMFK
jgi:hypothetical protein